MKDRNEINDYAKETSNHDPESQQLDGNLLARFGHIPESHGLKRRLRIHQGWWRMNVLNEEPGKHPKEKNKTVCNTIRNGETTKKNFLTPNTIKALESTLADRQESSPGMMQMDRLYDNLLSSQPLCFNFFGELFADKNFGLKVLQNWWPEITKLKRVDFEYAPKDRFTGDNSAFDVAFEVMVANKLGLIGLECKYTDTFSSKEYSKTAYEKIFAGSNSFNASYEVLKTSRYNQLFRNELLAEAIRQKGKYAFVRTGLFCQEMDHSAIKIAQEMKGMLKDPNHFTTITYRSYIEKIQRLDLCWELREWTMLLWARYCGTTLSEEIYQLIEKNANKMK